MIRFVIPYLLYSVIALVCIFMQSTLFSALQIFNAKPDLLLLLVVMSALKTDWKNGIVVGLLLGFWIDLINGGYFGMNMVVYSAVGALCGLLGRRFPDRTYEGYFFMAVVFALFAGFLTLTLFHVVGTEIPVWQSIIGTILPMTFYTGLIAFIGLPIIWFYRRRQGRKIGRIDLIGNGIIYVRGDEKVDMRRVAAHRAAKEKERRHRREKERRHEYEKSKMKREREDRKERRGAGSGSTRPKQRPQTRSEKSSEHKKPKSYPQRRPQKHSGRRSK